VDLNTVYVRRFVNPYKTMPEQTTCLVYKFDTEFVLFYPFVVGTQNKIHNALSVEWQRDPP